MRKRLLAALVVVLATAGLVFAREGGGAVQFKEARLIVETNATDGDAGLQVFLDHEPWRSISISRPDGEKIVDVQTRGVLRDYGLTELFSESSEPPFTEFPLAEFKKLFPEGRYTFAGETIEGTKMQSRVLLTHDFPPGPEISSPEDGSTLSADQVVVSWEPVDDDDVVSYQVLVTREADPLRVFSADVSSAVTQFHVPSEFFELGSTYKAEVLAVNDSGNQTLTEVEFEVS